MHEGACSPRNTETEVFDILRYVCFLVQLFYELYCLYVMLNRMFFSSPFSWTNYIWRVSYVSNCGPV